MSGVARKLDLTCVSVLSNRELCTQRRAAELAIVHVQQVAMARGRIERFSEENSSILREIQKVERRLLRFGVEQEVNQGALQSLPLRRQRADKRSPEELGKVLRSRLANVRCELAEREAERADASALSQEDSPLFKNRGCASRVSAASKVIPSTLGVAETHDRRRSWIQTSISFVFAAFEEAAMLLKDAALCPLRHLPFLKPKERA